MEDEDDCRRGKTRISLLTKTRSHPNGRTAGARTMDDTVPPLAAAIVPLFIAWALEDTPLPGQPEGHLYRCRNMTGARERLRDRGQNEIHILWNANTRGGTDRCRWKYDLESGRTVAVSDDEKADMANGPRAGKPPVPMASFRTHTTDRPTVYRVDFAIMGAAGCTVNLSWPGPGSQAAVDSDADMMTWTF